jgi:hypothetical protein
MPSLFDPITLGAVEAPNRILMAPLTRGRADKDAVPTEMMVDYYTQRASAGLIISEAAKGSAGRSHRVCGPTRRLPPGSPSPTRSTPLAAGSSRNCGTWVARSIRP